MATPITHLPHQHMDLYMKRDDLIHPQIPGSKFRKYESLIPYLKNSPYAEIIIYGGGRSHHVRSFMRYIREFAPELLNRHIVACLKMPHVPLILEELSTLHDLYQGHVIWGQDTNQIESQFPNALHLPEGAFVRESLRGAMTLGDEIADASLAFDHIYLDAGTGFSAWAAILALKLKKYSAEFTIVTMADDVNVMRAKYEQIQTWAHVLGLACVPSHMDDVRIVRPLTAKSFGVQNKTIENFMAEFTSQQGIALHHLYSAKLMHYVYNTPQAGCVLVVHSGVG